MADILVVAPHPDDETLGCGGTLLKHKAQGDRLFWAIVTQGSDATGHGKDALQKREKEIEKVAATYGFAKTFRLGFSAAMLDTYPKKDLVAGFAKVMEAAKPNVVYLPHPGDAHSDHAVAFEAALAPCKWFRAGSVKKILAYETLSETHFKPLGQPFVPNHYVDITPHLAKKIEIMKMYAGEMAPFPFPRSEEAIRAQAMVRGTQCGAHAAEAFMLLKEMWS